MKVVWLHMRSLVQNYFKKGPTLNIMRPAGTSVENKTYAAASSNLLDRSEWTRNVRGHDHKDVQGL